MVSIREIVSAIEERVPVRQQEDWDNSGWQITGHAADTECTGVLTCVDVTPEIVIEASQRGCNLILSHHPLIFKGLKRLTGSSITEQTVIAAIRHNIAIYSSHTSLDVVSNIGLSHEMGRRLGLQEMRVLAPQENRLLKLVTFVPEAYAQRVADAVFSVGAGCIGNYDRCSYQINGTGTFRALSGADPFVGKLGQDHAESEKRIEFILPQYLKGAAEQALRLSHPYEEPAFDFYCLDNDNQSTGLGVIGILPAPMSRENFISFVKTVYGSPMVRCSAASEQHEPISRVALCTGSGGEFIKTARNMRADAYITSDVRYHDFSDFGRDLLIIDTGHFESEACARDIFSRIISEKFANFAIYSAETETNPVKYK